MENQEIEQSLRDYPKQITNNSYLELLEKYFLSDKTNDLENKHKEWLIKFQIKDKDKKSSN